MYKVIIVDDEQMIKQSLLAMLKWDEENFRMVGEAENGSDALRLIREFSPDLVVTDINMPVMNGLQLIEEARLLGYKKEFVILTGYNEFEYAQKALRYQVSDYLLKPIKPDEFMAYLEKFKMEQAEIEQKEYNRNHFLQANMVLAQQIAEEIWQLNEAGLQRYMEALRQSDRLDFRDIYHMMIGCLKELAKHEDKLALFETDSEPLSLEALKAAFLTSMEAIRKNRKWGYRRSIQAAVEYIEANFKNSQLSLQDAADHVQMSPSFFSRSFKEALGINFIQYMTRLRMEKAKHLLLEQEELKTYEIAFEIGYTDYPHFSKAFKKYCGLSPSEYRRNMGSFL